MEEEITHATNRKPANNNQTTKLIAGIAIVLIIGIGSFVGGMQFQKSHGTTSTAAATNSRFAGQNGYGGQGSRGGFSRNGSFGAVTAISATSITVNDQRTSSTKTYTIDSSTAITNSGAAATYSDIKVGDNVIVRTSSSTSTTATTIALNPATGGPGGASTNASGTSSDGASTTTDTPDTSSL